MSDASNTTNRPVEEMDFIEIANTGKKRKATTSPRTLKYQLATSNRFQALSDDDEDDVENGPSCSYSSSTAPNSQPVPKIKFDMPPIVMYSQFKNHSKSIRLIATKLTGKIEFKHKTDRIIVFTQNLHDYGFFKDYITKAGIEFHTYTPKTELGPKMVVYLPSALTPDE
uniref:Uncharacterized protein n=1 Tax=Rhodnius prolixus TaxID=13249 RepID=T1HE15_RHOPR